MSDLISRQAVINAIANTCFWLSADNWEELTKCINSIPSADIMECARAIKEYCRDRDNLDEPCEGCPFHFCLGYRGYCCFEFGRDNYPSEWNLPEGEKE